MNTPFPRPPSLTLPLTGGGNSDNISHLRLNLWNARLGVSDGRGLLPPPLRGRAGEGGEEKPRAGRHG